jgi:hypothetical protein
MLIIVGCNSLATLCENYKRELATLCENYKRELILRPNQVFNTLMSYNFLKKKSKRVWIL